MADELLASGRVVSYGMHRQGLHNQHQSAIDQMDAGCAARITPERQKLRAETFDFEAHTDDILAVLHHESAPPE